MLHDIAAKFRVKATEKNITLQVDGKNNQAYVNADIEKIERVLTNLLENAIRHTPKNGKFDIKISDLAGQVGVSMIDTGIEISCVFDARYQASNTDRDASLHVGLGLATSQKLVVLLGSNLTVSSELGCGTSFSFSLSTVATD